MINARVARRYAEALVQMAEAEKNVDATTRDLELVKESIARSRDFLLFLRSPVINKARKRQVLQSVLADKIQKSTLESLGVIVLKGREELLPEIIEQFFSILDDRRGIVKVDVKAASEFSGDQKHALASKLEQYTRKKVQLAFGIDKQLIGGFVARVGDTVIDGSAKRQLELLRIRFEQGEEVN